jgi:hypothetical protein
VSNALHYLLSISCVWQVSVNVHTTAPALLATSVSWRAAVCACLEGGVRVCAGGRGAGDVRVREVFCALCSDLDSVHQFLDL